MSDRDREDFLSRLEMAVADDAAFVYAWCLMGNHFHLALRTGTAKLARTMTRMLTGYATSFNKRHRRDGHLFQNRFKSTVVDEERYFLALIRYIHLNPVRAKLVRDVNELKSYPWTGHSVFMGKAKRSWQDIDEALSRFGTRVGVARRELVKFMMSPEAKKDEKIFTGGGLVRSLGGLSELKKHRKKEKWAYDERILGSGRFVEDILKRAETDTAMKVVPETERAEKFARLLSLVSEKSGYSIEELIGKGRRRDLVKYRRLIVYLAVKHLGLTATAVGRTLSLSAPSALKAMNKGKEILGKLNWNTEELLRKVK